MADGIIYIKESDPPTDVTLHPTVPVTCPPSEMTLGVHQSVGLDIADCSVTFTQPLANQTLTIGALQSSNSFSRVARIVFSAISSPGSPWHGYRPDHCPVCSQDCNFHTYMYVAVVCENRTNSLLLLTLLLTSRGMIFTNSQSRNTPIFQSQKVYLKNA